MSKTGPVCCLPTTHTGMPMAALAAGILCCCCWLLPQHAAAQNFTGLRTGLWVPQQQAIDNTTATRELSELTTKLAQMRPGGPAQQQLLLLSAFSRSKLNNLTGNAEQVCVGVIVCQAGSL